MTEAIVLEYVRRRLDGMTVRSVGSTPTATGVDIIIRLDRYTEVKA